MYDSRCLVVLLLLYCVQADSYEISVLQGSHMTELARSQTAQQPGSMISIGDFPYLAHFVDEDVGDLSHFHNRDVLSVAHTSLQEASIGEP